MIIDGLNPVLEAIRSHPHRIRYVGVARGGENAAKRKCRENLQKRVPVLLTLFIAVSLSAATMEFVVPSGTVLTQGLDGHYLALVVRGEAIQIVDVIVCRAGGLVPGEFLMPFNRASR